MKKLILSSLALAALAFAGPSFADAECQAGSAHGYKEGCGGPDYGAAGPPPAAYYQGAVPLPNGYPVPYARGGQYPYVTADGRRVYVPNQYGVYPQYRISRRDRDGDGVTNRMDRFPDDPSRW